MCLTTGPEPRSGFSLQFDWLALNLHKKLAAVDCRMTSWLGIHQLSWQPRMGGTLVGLSAPVCVRFACCLAGAPGSRFRWPPPSVGGSARSRAARMRHNPGGRSRGLWDHRGRREPAGVRLRMTNESVPGHGRSCMARKLTPGLERPRKSTEARPSLVHTPERAFPERQPAATMVARFVPPQSQMWLRLARVSISYPDFRRVVAPHLGARRDAQPTTGSIHSPSDSGVRNLRNAQGPERLWPRHRATTAFRCSCRFWSDSPGAVEPPAPGSTSSAQPAPKAVSRRSSPLN